MLYNRLKLINGAIVLLVLLISVHVAASYTSNNPRLSTIAEEENWEVVATFRDYQDSHEIDDVEQMRTKSLDSSENFLDSKVPVYVELNDAQEHNQDLNLQKTHYDEVVAQLKAREWPVTLKAKNDE